MKPLFFVLDIVQSFYDYGSHLIFEVISDSCRLCKFSMILMGFPRIIYKLCSIYVYIKENVISY